MKITIEGDRKQVSDACKYIKIALRRGRGRPANPELQERRDRVLAERKILKMAFDLIRHRPNERKLIDSLAVALGGGRSATKALLLRAQEIIEDAETKMRTDGQRTEEDQP